MEHSSRYIVVFALLVCGVCSIFVAVSAVSLKPRQERNKAIDIQSKVLSLAGLLEDGMSADAISETFTSRIEPRIIDFETGAYAEGIDAIAFDQRAAAADPDTSKSAPPNDAQVRRVPDNAVVYHVMGEGGELEGLILPIHGKGLWSTLYGFIALGTDANSIRGITFYEHGETPGLGGEVDNPRWKSLWEGRKAFDERGQVAIRVKKGAAGPPEEDPYQVDGLSGATITARGVTATLAFWLGDDGFGSYLDQFRAERGI
ncbi:MAG: Na(+)-translocating NADH-quinone reductase subunit C [Myxococcota bacterium]|nr:Na(+)-translocating NADH-quinone reductase subunit C [Myxococcota bacterium]